MLTHGDVLLVWITRLLLPLKNGLCVGINIRIHLTDVRIIILHAYVALLLWQRYVA
jgi:hypothetical protein